MVECQLGQGKARQKRGKGQVMESGKASRASARQGLGTLKALPWAPVCLRNSGCKGSSNLQHRWGRQTLILP